ncbi:MAG: ACP S-malonyltransferase [Candidatus Eisenbacteria bacterium]|nr:ACP S-malonyltransferase [Candidatus Eisenbacteria bacterium]
MIGCLFPGQGAQYVGMGRDLYDELPVARRCLESADQILDLPLTRIMFEGPEEALRETRNAQPAILLHSVAVWEVLRDAGGVPAESEGMAAGHSLGEYSAYVAAGSLQFADALRLVRRRGELMYAAGLERPGAMAAVLGSAPEVVRDVCAATEGLVAPANFNSPSQVVISGEREAVANAGATLSERGAKRVVPLEVSGAFHSPLMASAADGLAAALAEVEIRPAAFPVYANASAEAVVEPDAIRASLVQQLLSPVLWEPTVRTLARRGAREFLEIGPGKVLRGLLRATDRSLGCRTLGTAAELTALREAS